MKKVKLIALLAAVVVGVGLYQFLDEIGKPAEVPRTEVVVAAIDIHSNTLITPEMLTVQPVATEALLTNYITDPNEVVGMVASGDIYAGEQLIYNRIVRMGDDTAGSDTLAYRIQPGMRAVSVSVNAVSGIENLLRPGDRVDVLVNVKYEEEETKDGVKEVETVTVSKTLMENIEILAVGNVVSKEGATEYVTVTMEVTPEQALLINYAGSGDSSYSSAGVTGMRLLLRSPLDNEPMEDTEIFLSDILGDLLPQGKAASPQPEGGEE